MQRALLPTSRLSFRGASLKLSDNHSISRLRSSHRRALPLAAVMSPSAERGASISEPSQSLILERNNSGLQRLAYQKEGWQYWNWNDSKTGQHRIHYISAGENNPGPTVLLIHGFGASAYHWRHNIPALVDAGCRVFAVDLLGFGLSDKALVSYEDYSVWQRQLTAFMTDVVKHKCVLVGNSLGGYTSLSAAAANPSQVTGVALLNGAGRFEDLDKSAAQQKQDIVEIDPLAGKPVQREPEEPLLPPSPTLWQQLVAVPKGLSVRVGLYFAFLYAKQPLRIRQVLNKVYVDNANVDDDLVESILQPAQDGAAAECFRLILSGSGTSINSLLAKMEQPLLLLWGDRDPWIGPGSADRVMQLYPSATRIRLNAGHCPHDEAPEATNEGLLSWLATLES